MNELRKTVFQWDSMLAWSRPVSSGEGIQADLAFSKQDTRTARSISYIDFLKEVWMIFFGYSLGLFGYSSLDAVF
jgi:hypothetical protein